MYNFKHGKNFLVFNIVIISKSIQLFIDLEFIKSSVKWKILVFSVGPGMQVECLIEKNSFHMEPMTSSPLKVSVNQNVKYKRTDTP